MGGAESKYKDYYTAVVEAHNKLPELIRTKIDERNIAMASNAEAKGANDIRIKTNFVNCDVDKDGMLNKKEWFQFCQNEHNNLKSIAGEFPYNQALTAHGFEVYQFSDNGGVTWADYENGVRLVVQFMMEG